MVGDDLKATDEDDDSFFFSVEDLKKEELTGNAVRHQLSTLNVDDDAFGDALREAKVEAETYAYDHGLI